MKFEAKDILETLVNYGDYYNQHRAIPSIRDGLKPSQRKVLYAASKLNLKAGKGTKKADLLVGSAVEIYQHGRNSLEGTIIRMGQEFKMGNTLFNIEGNYGSQATITAPDAGAAATRYLGITTTTLGDELLKSIKTGTAVYIPHQEDPVSLWLNIPGFLLFAQRGIGVGTATSTPAFTLDSVKAITKTLIEQDGDVTSKQLADTLVPTIEQQPILINKEDMEEIFEQNGKKSFRYVARFQSRANILRVTNFPFGVSPNMVIKEISKSLDEVPNFKKIIKVQDTSSVRADGGTDVSLELYLKNRTNVDELINDLRAKTSLESTQSVNLTLVNKDGLAKEYSYPQALKEWFGIYKEEAIKVLEGEVKELDRKIFKAQASALAVDNIDLVVEIIKNSENKQDAIDNLSEKLNTAKEAAQIIVAMPLSSLTRMDRKKINDEINKLQDLKSDTIETMNNPEKFKSYLTKESDIKVKSTKGVTMKNDIRKPTFMSTDFYVKSKKKRGVDLYTFTSSAEYSPSAIKGDSKNPIYVYYENRVKRIDKAGMEVENVHTDIVKPFYYHISTDGMVKGTDSAEVGAIRDREVVGWEVTQVIGTDSSADGYLKVDTNMGSVQVPVAEIPLTKFRNGAKGVKLVNLKKGEVIEKVYFIDKPYKKYPIGRNARTNKR